MRTIVTFSIAIIILSSCSYHISEDDYDCNPYLTNDTLIFKNNLGKYDTVVIMDINVYTSADDPLAIFPDYNEYLDVRARYHSPGKYNGHVENPWISIIATKDGTNLYFNLAMKETWYYGKQRFTMQQLDSFPRINITTEEYVYNDVIKIISDNIEYKHRNNSVDAFYWSNEYGYVRVELTNGNYWELIERKRSDNPIPITKPEFKLL